MPCRSGTIAASTSFYKYFPRASQPRPLPARAGVLTLFAAHADSVLSGAIGVLSQCRVAPASPPPCSTWCPCCAGADWCLESDAVPDLGLQVGLGLAFQRLVHFDMSPIGCFVIQTVVSFYNPTHPDSAPQLQPGIV